MKGSSGASSYGKALVNLQETIAPYSDSYIDAPFYTNHDMGRSAGYYSGDYSENQTKMGQAMNLLMSGSSFLYYGEELGMKGSGKDENKRAPMYWTKEEGNLAKLIEEADELASDVITALGDKAKERIREWYSWEYITAEYEKVFLYDTEK